MTKFFYHGVLSILFVGAMVLTPLAHAETTTTVDAKTAQIKALMLKLEELQKQISTLQGEVREVLKSGMVEGATNEDIKKIQELLATDPAIYPEGKVTGYFGPLTKEAIKRFQTRHGLEVTGTIDENTKKLMEEYLKERKNGVVPPGLLHAPGIEKKMEMQFREKCNITVTANKELCERLKMKSEHGSTTRADHKKLDMHTTKDHKMTRDTDFDVHIDIDGTTHVAMTFTFNGKEYGLEGELTDIDDLIDATADELNMRASEIDMNLRMAIKHKLLDTIEKDTHHEDENESN